jgi:hypothetical protein
MVWAKSDPISLHAYCGDKLSRYNLVELKSLQSYRMQKKFIIYKKFW